MGITIERKEVRDIEYDHGLRDAASHELQDDATIKAFSSVDRLQLKQEILNLYNDIDYKDLDEVNEKRFSEIERRFRLLHLSNLHFSSRENEEVMATFKLLLISINAVQRRVKSQLDCFHKENDWSNLWDFEDKIIYDLIDLVNLLQELKLSVVNDDKELKKIGKRTLTHKYTKALTKRGKKKTALEYMDSYELSQTHCTPVNTSRRDKYERHNADYLWLFYVLKTKEDKTEFRKTVLTDYLDREKANSSKSSNFNNAVYKFLLRDFQGDFSVIVKNRRKAKGWTQQQLADAVGVERTMITKVEKVNAVSSLETTIRLLTTLDLQLMICPLDISEEIPYEEHVSKTYVSDINKE